MKRLIAVSVAATCVLGWSLLRGDDAQPQAAGTFKADPVHSSVVFKVGHLGVSLVYGRFNDLSGSFVLDPEDPSNNTFQFEIKAASIDTNVEKRDNHLRSPDFFNVEKHPTIRFHSTKVAAGKGDEYLVDGELTLLGVTKPLQVAIERTGVGTDRDGNVRAGLHCVFRIKRSEFGMTKYPKLVGDEVTLMIAIEGIRQ